MGYFVLKGHSVHEPTDAETLFAKLQSGELLPSDLAQAEGTNYWTHLYTLFPPATLGDRVDAGAARLKERLSIWKQRPLEPGIFCAVAGCLIFLASHWPILLYGPFILGAAAAGALLMLRGRLAAGLSLALGAVLVPALLSTAFHPGKHPAEPTSQPAPPEAVAVQTTSPAAKQGQPESNPEARLVASSPVSDPASAPRNAESPSPAPSVETDLMAPGAPKPEASGSAAPPHAIAPGTGLATSSAKVAASSSIAPSSVAGESAAPETGGMVLIDTGNGKGSGFFAHMNGRSYLITNGNVVAGARRIQCTSSDGKRFAFEKGRIELAEDRDLVRFAIDSDRCLELAKDAPGIDSRIFAYENGDGDGVVTKLEGKVLGLGPKEIEVSAAFIAEDSGGPILNSQGEVVGVATYNTPDSNIAEWIKDGNRSTTPRRTGMRLDGSIHWTSVPLDQFQRQSATIEEAAGLLGEYIGFTQELGRGPFTRTIKTQYGAKRTDVTGYVGYYNNLCTPNSARSGLEGRVQTARESLMQIVRSTANSFKGTSSAPMPGFLKIRAAAVVKNLNELAILLDPHGSEEDWKRIF